MKSSTCDWVGNQNFVVINVQAHFLLPATESKAHDRNAAREYNCRKLVGTSPLLGISPDSTCTPWNLVGAFQLWTMLKFTSAPPGTSRTQGAGTKPNLRLAVLGKKVDKKDSCSCLLHSAWHLCKKLCWNTCREPAPARHLFRNVLSELQLPACRTNDFC